jgi:murein DD-endopeptidase MepM/ murein hydrolase activator NlpD
MNSRHSASHKGLSLTKLVISMGFLLIIPGAVAYAGVFSYLADIFTKVTAEDRPITSQNMALLAAVGGPDLKEESLGSEMNTVSGGALLPDAGPDGGLADIDSESGNSGQISIYVVRSGDSFSSIAKMYGVSVNTILWANDLSRGATLSVGQTLVILPVSGVQHTVKKGDTLASIAKKYKADADEIIRYNGLDEGPLAVGSIVIVPDGEIAIPVSSNPIVRATSKLRGGGGPTFDGYYAAPLPAGYRRTQGLHGYNGIDLTLYRGAPVSAAAGGQVIIARSSGYNGGYGKYIVISHGNGTQTLYGHLDAVLVTQGQVVFQGQNIGTEGNTGRSTGPHLHFEVRGGRNPF